MTLPNPVLRTYSVRQLNRVSFWVLPLLAVAFGGPYVLLWFSSLEAFLVGFSAPLLKQLQWCGLLVGGYAAGLGFHELIHGLTWALLTPGGFRHIRFGLFRNSGILYCHISKPVRLSSYLAGLLMPGLTLGLIPAILSWFTGSSLLLVWGIALTQAATGDAIMGYRLWQEKAGSWVQDHPDQLGYWLYPSEK